MRLSVAAAALATILALPRAGSAQDLEAQARAYLNRAIADREEAWQAAWPVESASMGEQARYVLHVDLTGGAEYLVVAACDDNCLDLDLFVYDPSGDLVAEDAASGDFPEGRFTAPVAGTYEVVLRMARCAAEVCHFAAQALR